MTDRRTRTQNGDSRALVLAGHGSHVAPESSEAILAHVDRLRGGETFEEVTAAFWKGEPHLRDVLRTVASEHVTVVPLMMTSGYFTNEVVPRELRLEPDQSPTSVRSVHYTAPIGTHPALADLVDHRANAVAGDAADGLAVVGHGTTRHEQSGESAHRHAARLRSDGRFSEVRAFFLDEDPTVDSLTSEMDARKIVIVPLFGANGSHTSVDIPRAIGLPPEPAGATEVDGKRLWYTDPVGTAAALSGLVLDRATSGTAMIAKEGSADIAGDPESATEAFGQRLQEAVSGGSGWQEWGELRITVRSPPGEPTRYSVRHRRNAGTRAENLERLPDGAAIRERVRFDESGQYRPLSGARTLPPGWIASDRSLPELLRVIDAIYPASVANWYRERADCLDVTSFDAAAERHTGRFADLGEVSPAVRRRTIAACCDACVRRPVWATGHQHTQGQPIPCREPCSFLLEAVWHFRDLDRPPRPDDVVDPSVPPGQLNHAGNRYRTRYLELRERGVDAAARGVP